MSCTELVIRHANKHDMKAVAGMIVELAAYHKTRELPKTTWRDLQLDGFESESPAFQCVVAEGKKDNERVIVGYAFYFPIYSSREGRGLMLEDIFVQVNERHSGIGNLLFNTVVKELGHYHNVVGSPENTVRGLQIAGFESGPPAFRCVVAEVKNDNKVSIVGYALYFPIYSSWQGRSLYLQSVFVKDSERHRGIGNLLFDAVAKEAYSSGCGRVDFHVARWNRAQTWYEGKGAVNLTDRDGRCYWRLSGAALQAAASRGSEK